MPDQGNQAVPPSIGRIVGANLRRLRNLWKHTCNDATRQIHERTGQVWSRSEIGILENGKRESITINDLATLACAYQVPVTELLSGNGAVRLGGGFHVSLDSLTRPEAPPQRLNDPGDESQQLGAWRTEADKAAAERLGISPSEVTEAALRLWGHTLTDERDARLGETSSLPPRTLQGKRGAMTRALTAELRASLKV